MNYRFHSIVFCLVIALGLPGGTNADFITNSFGLVSPDQVIEFDEVSDLPIKICVLNQYEKFGVVFSPCLLESLGKFFPNPNGDEFFLGNYFFVADGPVFNPFSIKFTQPVDAAAFSISTWQGETTFSALLGGEVVETHVASTGFTSVNNFFGFEGIVFDEIVVEISADNGIDIGIIDNLQYNLFGTLGDVNCDGSVDLLDVSPFVNLIARKDFDTKADVNQDGVVNLLNVAPFVELIIAG